LTRGQPAELALNQSVPRTNKTAKSQTNSSKPVQSRLRRSIDISAGSE